MMEPLSRVCSLSQCSTSGFIVAQQIINQSCRYKLINKQVLAGMENSNLAAFLGVLKRKPQPKTQLLQDLAHLQFS